MCEGGRRRRCARGEGGDDVRGGRLHAEDAKDEKEEHLNEQHVDHARQRAQQRVDDELHARVARDHPQGPQRAQ
eukprot:3905601-Prymnesium_polylepis.1